VIHVQDVAIDLDAKLVTRAGSPVRLTATEYRLLEVLATNAGRLCTHRYLLERVWGPGYGEESQYLRVYVANLRRKLDDPSDPRILLTEPGMGYRFLAEGAGQLKGEAAPAVVGGPLEPSGSSPANKGGS
jgi:two-component system KDP operon response regulator KdpE